MHSMKRKRAPGWLFALLLLASLLAACGGRPGAALSPGTSSLIIPKVALVARDSSFVLPPALHAGPVDITMVNEGTRVHTAQFARLKPGVTLEQIQATLHNGPDAIIALVVPSGGMLAVQPGHSQEVILDLPAGQYVVLNFLAGDETLPRADKAFATAFTVTGPANTQQVRPSGAVIQVTMRDFSFDTPDALPSGLLTYRVTNRGAQAHEMVFLRLAAGKTWRDVMAFLQSPKGRTLPGTVVGGMSALSPGETAWVKMNLAPGTYIILCFLPDKSSRLLHEQLGMICSITVR
jgi:hypothetical protein